MKRKIADDSSLRLKHKNALNANFIANTACVHLTEPSLRNKKVYKRRITNAIASNPPNLLLHQKQLQKNKHSSKVGNKLKYSVASHLGLGDGLKREINTASK